MSITENLITKANSSKQLLYKRDSCPDCGFWLACDNCSVRYSKIDIEIRLKEGKPVNDYTLGRYGFKQ